MSKTIEQASKEFAEQGVWQCPTSFEEGAKFVQCQFTKEKVIEILKARNEKAFSKFQKYEYNRMIEAIATIEKLVPPDCFFL